MTPKWLIIMASSEAGFVPITITRPSCRQCVIPLDLTQLSCPGFTLAAGLPSGFTTDRVGCWGGSPVESLQSHFILTMSHYSSGLPVCFPSQGTQVQIPWGVLRWNRDSPVSVVLLQFINKYKAQSSYAFYLEKGAVAKRGGSASWAVRQTRRAETKI